MGCPTAAITSTDTRNYIVKVGNYFIKKLEDNGDITLTPSWEFAKKCDDLEHAQSCAETYGGAVYQITRSIEPVVVDEG